MPLIPGWSDDERERRARGLAALIRRVWRLIARQIAAQAERQDAITLATARTIIPQWTTAIDDQIIGYVERMYLDAAGTVSDALEVPESQLIGDDLVDHFTSEARNRLRGIGNDVWADVQAQITLGNQSGESISEIAARIRNVTGVSEARSLTIARTEVHAAHEAGSHAQALFVDPNGEKVWLSTEDERTRPSHKRADGQAVKIGEPFTIGTTKLRYPGDPLGDPGETINCRCSVAYNFDMITTVVEEPEPAMVAAGQQWKPHMHPRGNDGKFIEKGALSDFLKKAKPNIIDVSKAVGSMTGSQYEKLTDAQKQYIKDSVDKLPHGTETHTKTKTMLDIVEKMTAPKPSAATPDAPKPKTKIGETYAKLKDAKHGDVLATGTKYNPAGVAQKFKITADKSSIHPDYNPYGKMKLEFLKKNGEPSGKPTTGDILSISQKLHPLPVKGKSGKVEWDAPGEADAPKTPTVLKPDPSKLTVTGKTLGSHGAQVYKDPDGNNWLFKKQPKFATDLDVGASELQRAMGRPSPETYAITLDGKAGSIQRMIEGKDAFEKPWNFEASKISDQDKKELLREQPLDWLLSNFDSHSENYIKLPDGQVLGVDKGNGLKFFGQDSLTDYGWRPNEHRTVYSHLWMDYAKGATDITESDLAALRESIDKLQAIPDDDIRTMFRPYAEGAHKMGNLATATSNPWAEDLHPSTVPTQNVDAFLDAIVMRKHALKSDFAALYAKATADRNKTISSNKPTVATPLLDAPSPEVNAPDFAPNPPKPGPKPVTPTGTKIPDGLKGKPGDPAKVTTGVIWGKHKPGDIILESGDNSDFVEWDGKKYLHVVDGAVESEWTKKDAYAKLKGNTHWVVPGGTKTGDDDEPGIDPTAPLPDIKGLDDPSARGNGVVSTPEGYEPTPDEIDAGVAQWERDNAGFSTDKETGQLLDDVLGPEVQAPSGSTISGETLSLKQLHALIVGSKSKHTGGQVIATSPDGTKRITWSALYKDYVLQDDNGVDEVITNMKAIQTIRKENYAVTESLVPGGKGEIPPPAPSYDGPIGDYTQFVPTPADVPDVFTAPNKQMSLNDLKSGLLSLDEAVVLAPQLTLADYKALTHTERAKMEALTSAAKNLNMPNAADGYKAWTNLKHEYQYDKGLITEDEYHDLIGKPSDITYSPEGNAPPADLDVPDKDAMGVGTTNAGALYWLKTGAHDKMMTEDGKYKLTVVDSPMGKYALEQKQDDGTTITAFVNSGNDVDYTVGMQVWFPAKKASAGKSHVDALDLMTRGKTNTTMVSADGAHTLEKGDFTDFEVTTKSDDGGEDTYGFDTADQLEAHLGNSVTWFPEGQQQPDATNAPANAPTAAVPTRLLDLDLVDEKVKDQEYTSGETIGVTKDGEYALLYSAILDGLVYNKKNGNTSTDPTEWDTIATYEHDYGDEEDGPMSAIQQFKDDTGVELFDPVVTTSDAPGATTNKPDYSWVKTSGFYADGEIVATSQNDKFRMVKAGPNMYDILEHQDDGTWSWIDGLEYEELNDKLPQLGDGVWKQKAGGIKHQTTSPAKKFAKKVAKKAAPAGPVTGIYNSAHVTPSEKKFYLEDSEWGSLVPAEAVHLLSGSGGLDYNDWTGLTPTQSDNIEKMLHKAVDQGKPGAQGALDKWGDFAKVQQSTPLSGPVPGDGATLDKWLDLEDKMFAGDISPGDILATSSDGNEQIVAWSSASDPFGNPDGFAHQTVDESGIPTTIKTYGAGYGGPAGLLNDDIGGKTWLDPNDAQGAPDDVLDAASVDQTFNPPGTGAIPPSVVFNMLDFMDADDKAVLVGKDSDGGTWKMSVGLNADGEKVVKISSWHPSQQKFVPNAEVANKHEYDAWDDAGIKWDPPSAISNPEILNDTPNVTAPAAPELNPKNVNAIWDHVQTMNVKDVYAVSKNGEFRLSVAGGPPGDKYLVVESKKADGSGWDFFTAPGTNKTKLMKHLNLNVGQGHDWQQPTKSDTTTVLPAGSVLAPNDAQKLWETAQKLDEDTVIATGKSKSGSDVQMVVKKDANGNSVVTVQKKDSPAGSWYFWYTNQNVQQTKDDLIEDTWSTEVDLQDVVSSTPAVSAPAAPGTSTLDLPEFTQENVDDIWAKIQTLPAGTELATSESYAGWDTKMVVTGTGPAKHLQTMRKNPNTGEWTTWHTLNDKYLLKDEMIDFTWTKTFTPSAVPATSPNINGMTGMAPHTPIGSSYWATLTSIKDSIPGGTVVAVHNQSGSTLIKTHAGKWAVENADGYQIGVSLVYPQDAWSVVPGDWHTPNTPGVMPSATVTPTAPSVSTPPAPKLIPINKVHDLKNHMKGGGLNIGYWSKPESIWKAVKEWQAKPGNDQYSPMDIFKSLDNTLKTTKPNPFQEKMTKWAASAKGIQTIGPDGIMGPKPSAPAATSKLDFTQSPGNAAKIWSSLDSLPDGTILAHTSASGVDKQMYVITAPNGTKIIHIKVFDPVSAHWDAYASYTSIDMLEAGLVQNWKPGPKGSVAAPLGAPPKMPNIDAGSDISGISVAKQQDVYDKFKGQPGTYLSSSEGSIFDAFDAISKSEGLTLAQAINIVDELGAKKVNKPNAGLFKQKISTWLKTPQGTAHILNEPTVVTGLPTPPSFLPQYNPDTHLMSFDESSKLTYDYVASNATATSYWNSIVAKSEPISPSQKKALTTWTGGTYTTVNTYLFKPGMPALSSTHKGVIKGAQEGMRPSDRPMVLVRGTGYDGLGNAANHAQLEKMVGQTWRNNAFAATSVGKSSHDAPGVHSPAFSHFPLWIEYECPPGTPMAWLAPFSSVGQGEREMLLAANLHYKIVSVEKKNVPGHGMKTIARVRIVPKPEDAA